MEKLNKKAFGDSWKMFNEVRKNNTDEGWTKCIETAEKISEENTGEVYKKLLLAVVGEAERESKIKDEKSRNEVYRIAAKAFNEAWKLYESLERSFDIGKLHAYCMENSGRFASDLGAALYEFECEKRLSCGDFMKALYEFYKKYHDGITDDVAHEAFKESEMLIEKHPGHALQMLEVFHELKALGEINNNAVKIAV